MATTLTAEQRYELITRGIADVHGGESIKAILNGGRNPCCMWATAPTGRPHIGYVVPMIKLAEFLQAGVDLKIVIGDIYAFLINYKYPLSQVQHRATIYRNLLTATLDVIGVPASKLTFFQETQHHFAPSPVAEILKAFTIMQQSDARATGEELSNTAMLSPLLTPALQALDEEFVGADFEFGGLDQEGIFAFSRTMLPKMGYRARAHLMSSMLPGLIPGDKMSASVPSSKIDLLDSPSTILHKLSTAERNGLLGLVRMIIMPISRLRLEMGGAGEGGAAFVGEGAPKGTLWTVGGRHYAAYEEVERDLAGGKVGEGEVRVTVAECVSKLLGRVRDRYEKDEEWKRVDKLAYPDVEATELAQVERPVNFCYSIKELENSRIKLTPFNPIHHSGPYFAHTANHPEVYAHMPIGPFSSPADFTANFIDAVVTPNPTMVLFAILDKTKSSPEHPDGLLAGVLSLMNTSTTNRSTEIGFVVIFPPFQQTHVTSNAVGLLMQYCLDAPDQGGLGLRRVAWQTSSANVASQRTADRLGFVKEGVLRWDRVFAGGVDKGKEGNGENAKPGEEKDVGRDTVVYSVVWQEWLGPGGVREKLVSIMERNK